MASYDGSITIGTKLDTSGFKGGSDELLAAIKSLSAKIEALGKTIETAMEKLGTGGAAKAMDATKAATDRATKSAKDLGKAASDASRDASRATSDLGKGITAAGKKMEALGPLAARAASGNASAIARFDERARGMEATLQGLREKLNAFGDTRKPTEAFQELEDRLAKLQAKLEEFKKAGIKDEGLADTKRQIEEVKDAMADLEKAGGAYTFGRDTEAFRAYNEQLSEMETHLRDMNDAVHPADGVRGALDSIADGARRARDAVMDFFGGMSDAASKAGTATEGISGAFRGITDSILGAMDAATDKILQFGSAISSSLGSGMNSVVSTIMGIPEALDRITSSGASGVLNAINVGLGKIGAAAGYAVGQLLRLVGSGVLWALKSLAKAALDVAVNLAKMVGDTVITWLKNVAKAAGDAAANLAQMAGQKISSGIGGLVKNMLGLGNSVEDTSGQFKHSFLAILKYVFGIRSLFFLFRKLRRAMAEGLKELAGFDPQLNSAISSLMGALTNLRNAFAAAFSPIIKVVAPILTYFINMIASAVNHIGMLIAALTGQKTFIKAAGATAKFAGASDKAAKSSSKAAKAAKEEKKQLASFDELDILSGSGSGGSGGGGGGGGGGLGTGGTGSMFQTVAIDPAVFDWVERLKAAFRRGDYDEVGRILAEKINEQLSRVKDLISWDRVGPTITKYVDMICRIFNSLARNIDWDLIGRTFAEGINTVLHTFDLFYTGIDWLELGRDFAKGLNGLVDAVDWGLLGKTLADKFNSKLDMLYGAISTFDWKKLGSSIGESVNNAIKTIKWGEIGQTISSAFKGFFDAISAFFQKVDWKTFAKSIEEAFANIDWAGVAQSVFGALGSAFGGLAQFFGTLIGDAVQGAKDYFDEKIEEAGGNVVEGIWNGIKDAMGGAWQWIKDNVFTPFIDGFKKAFGIGSPAKEMKPFGGDIIDGLFNGIKEAMGGAASWVRDNILGPIKDAFQNAWKGAGAALEVGVSLVKDGWSNFTDWVGEKKEAAIDVFVGLKEKAGEWSKDAWEALKSGGGTVKSKVETALEKASTWAGDAWTAIKSGGETAKHTLQSAVEKASTWVGDAWKAVTGGGTDTHTLNSAVKQGSWNSEAWSAAKKSGTTQHTLQSNVKKGGSNNWNKDAWTAAQKRTETITRTLQVAVKAAQGTSMALVNKLVRLARGGIISGGRLSRLPQFASGGVINGVTKALRHFTTAAGGYTGHGSLVLAGEAGPEIVGRVGSRTEILNKSQMASALYTAVVNGMTSVSNRLAQVLANIVAQGAGAVRDAVLYTTIAPVVLPASFDGYPTNVLSSLQALEKVATLMPVMASGTVMPYATTAPAASAQDIQAALDTSNTALANRLTAQINAAAVAIVQAVRESGARNAVIDTAALTQAAIDEINRRTVAFSGSPLTGV